jgi:hypothetical protein
MHCLLLLLLLLLLLAAGRALLAACVCRVLCPHPACERCRATTERAAR